MDTLLRVGLSNAAAACVLAVVAAAVGYFCRRPAVRHALWLLVLLKLVTPPLIDVPVWRPAEAPPAPVAEAPPAPAEEPPEPAVEVELAPAPDDAAAPAVADEAPDGAEEPVAVPAPEPAEAPAAAQPEGPREPPAAPAVIAWQPLALTVWLGGSGVWLLLAALRARRFARLLRYAQPAPKWLRREADGLAARLGLWAPPVVFLLPGRVSPMLWAPGWSARLLLPAELLGRLDPAGRRTLLAHELAHLRRRDHRVRLFELLVTALFWWHPVVWWARRELREAEEQCCDAWVLWALPESAKTYALALVETVDFLSEAPAALPALASGVGQVHDLRRRVTMIMQGTTPRALTWGGVLCLFGLGAFLLPVMPSWAQEAEQPIRAREVAPAGDDVKKADAELDRLMIELKKRQADLQQLQAQIEQARKRMAEAARAGAGGAKEKPDGVIVLEIIDGDKRQVIKLPAGSKVLRSEDLRGKPIDAKEEMARRVLEKRLIDLKMQADAARAQEKPHALIIEVISDGKRQVIELPPGSRVISGGEAGWGYRVVRPGNVAVPKPGQPEVPPIPKAGQPVPMLPAQPGLEIKRDDVRWKVLDPRAADTDKRIADLEKRLEELTRAVRELRMELQKGKPVPQVPGRTGTNERNFEIEVRPVEKGPAPGR